MRPLALAAALGVLIATPAWSQDPVAAPPPDAASKAVVDKILASDAFKKAIPLFDREHERIVGDIIKLTEIPAPPFKEEARAKAYLEMLKAHGLTDVEADEEGNVMGLRKGTGGGPLIAIAAHLDTVFPEDTDVTVKKQGTRLMAPGIGDDTRSLAVLLAFVRAMDAAGIKTKSDILIIGDVGEEGLGDLRGMKYLFGKGKYKDRIKTFISMDGTNAARIVNGGVGSKRYRVTYKGPGGHSFGAFGLVNPMFAMAQAMEEFSKIAVPLAPKTTYSVGVIGGGTSVNSIPNESWMEIDMRSESAEELAKVEKRFLAIVQQAVETENSARSTKEGPITVDPKLIGDRPSGQTDAKVPLVQLANAAISGHGLKAEYQYSSTDSNTPMSLGIPAITIGSGGKGGRSHSLDEWIDVEKESSVKGMIVSFTIVLAAAGME